MIKLDKKAFTLVELIVVITILAILGTIAFLALQGYSANARDTKRINNLGNISNVINYNIIRNSKVESFLINQTNTISGHTYGGKQSLLGTNYDVGELNYESLLIKEDDFLDPNGKKYIIGYSTLYQTNYQISATLENSGVKIAKIAGNYNPRKSDETQSTIISGFGTKKIYLSRNNGIKQQDTIISNGVIPVELKVIDLSSNNLGFKVILNGIIPNDATYIKLKTDDTPGLISDKDDNTKAIIEGENYLPY